MTRYNFGVIAQVAQDAARREVLATMEAHNRFNPWEVHEVGLHYAIRDGLLAHFSTLPAPRPRVVNEYGASAMANIDFAILDNHPVDIAVLHPLMEATAPNNSSGHAWAAENKTALGVIEVKKNWKNAAADAIWLDKLSGTPGMPGLRKLEWVILVVFLAGRTPEAVVSLAAATQEMIAKWSFETLTLSDPIQAPSHPGSAGVADRWFDVMCYGKPCTRAK